MTTTETETGTAQPEIIVAESLLEIVELDEAWAVPCECTGMYGCGGNNEASWIAHWTPCCPTPKSILYCTKCKNLLVGSPALFCGDCDKLFRPGSTAFVLIEPLNPR